MAGENVQAVQAAYAIFDSEGVEAVAELLDSEIVSVAPRDAPNSGSYPGRDGFIQFITDWIAMFDEFEWVSDEFIDAGDHVIVVGRQTGRGRASGSKITEGQAHLWTFRDGRTIRFEMFRDRAEAFAAIGMPQQESGS